MTAASTCLTTSVRQWSSPRSSQSRHSMLFRIARAVGFAPLGFLLSTGLRFGIGLAITAGSMIHLLFVAPDEYSVQGVIFPETGPGLGVMVSDDY